MKKEQSKTPDLLILKEIINSDYAEIHKGYNSRDSLVPQQMYWIAIVFGALVALFSFTYETINVLYVALIIITIIGLMGLALLIALHIDMISNISCKRALRDRMKAIEEAVQNQTLLSTEDALMWHCIDNRERFWEERIKGNTSGRKYLKFWTTMGESPYYVWAGRLACILWFILIPIFFHLILVHFDL